MTREELEQCIGYEVIVDVGGGAHEHGVLVKADGIVGVVDHGGGHPLYRYDGRRLRCLGLLQRRWQEAQIAAAMPKLVAHECTCGVVISSCPVHCPGVKP